MTKAARYLLYSQVSFFGSLLICLLLSPQVISGNLGISYYGNYRRTIIPYLCGLLLTSYFITKAARILNHSSRTFNILSEILMVLAVLIIGVSLTPYSVDTLFDRAHVLTSAILFMVELGLAIWLVVITPRKFALILLLTLQIIGAFICATSLLTSIALMLTGQIITQLAFGILLIKAVELLCVPDSPKE